MDDSQTNISIPDLKMDYTGRISTPLRERQKIKNEHYRNEWTGCCSKTDRNFLKYITQISMGGVVMIFCMVQIFLGAESAEIYFSLLSGTLGLFLPHPQIGKD